MLQSKEEVRNIEKITDRNRRRVGKLYEDMAAEYLKARGHRIAARNFNCVFGEIDLITRVKREDRDYWDAEDTEYLVFVEVKYRSGISCGEAEYAVDARKQRRIRRAAEFYMLSHGIPENTCCRFDVVAIQENEIHYYQDAFGGM